MRILGENMRMIGNAVRPAIATLPMGVGFCASMPASAPARSGILQALGGTIS